MPDLQCTLSRIQQRFQVWPLRSDPFVFIRSFEPLPIPFKCFYALRSLSTSGNPKPRGPQSNNILRHWTQINRRQAPMKPLKVTAPHTKTNDRLVAANPSFHSFSANNILLSIAQMQCKTLQTHILLPRCSLSLLHAHKFKAQTPQILIIPRHHPP